MSEVGDAIPPNGDGDGGEQSASDLPGLVVESATIPDDGERNWADVWAHRLLASLPSKASAKKALKRGEVVIDGEVNTHCVVIGPGTTIGRLQSTRAAPRVFQLRLKVIHQDDDFAAVEKPPGFATNGPWHRTIEHALPKNLTTSPDVDALRWPRPAHRLDRPTGGVLLIGKTASALASIGRQFQERSIHKRYRCISVGRLEGSGVFDDPIEGRDALTRWQAIGHSRSLKSGWLTTLDLWPETGRTHQLRRHLSAAGHPILGDTIYGIEGLILRGKGLFLWAMHLEMSHPRTGEPMSFTLLEPPKFAGMRARESRRWLRYNEPETES